MKGFKKNGMPRKPYKKQAVKPVYQFDIEGNLIYKHQSVEMACENLFIRPSAMRAAIRRKGCYHGKWHFSYNKEFKVPMKRWSHTGIGGRNKDFLLDFFPLDD
jgi:hypothetical protein